MSLVLGFVHNGAIVLLNRRRDDTADTRLHAPSLNPANPATNPPTLVQGSLGSARSGFPKTLNPM